MQTPAEAIEDLIDKVESFNLQQGIENDLNAKLDAALRVLNNGNDGAAINVLQAFINAVEAQRGNHLTDAQADELVNAAQGIIDTLTSTPTPTPTATPTGTPTPTTCYTLSATTDPVVSGLSVAASPGYNCGTSSGYIPGTTVTITVAGSVAGYAFDYWEGTGNSTDLTQVITINADMTVIAHYTATCYTLSVTVNPIGSITVSPTNSAGCSTNEFTPGTTVTLTAASTGGYAFSDWTGDLTGTTNPATLTMDSAKSVTGNFVAVDCYTLDLAIFQNGIGGSVAASPGTNCIIAATGLPGYTSGTVVTFTATPDIGYEFKDWHGASDSNSSTLILTITSNTTLQGHFRPQCFALTITINQPTWGTISASLAPDCTISSRETEYQAGQSVTLTATPDATEGTEFAFWDGDVSTDTSPTLSLTMSADITVQAHFSGQLHISGMTLGVVDGQGNKSDATATVTVVDQNNNVIQGATVTGRWLSTGTTVSTTTDASGVATFTLSVSCTIQSFTVTTSTGISKTDYTYDSSSNTPSNATTDTVTCP